MMNDNQLTPERNKALEMAQEFARYCRSINLRSDEILAGVAWDAACIQEIAFEEGVEKEYTRVKKIIGM